MMLRFYVVFSVILPVIFAVTFDRSFPPSPIEFRGLWCVSEQNIKNGHYSQQLGQAFFYNNETFTMNFLNNIAFTWVNHFLAVNNTDANGTYQVFTDTTQGASVFINVTSCFWRRRLPNGDLVWGRQSNGTCTPTFEYETGTIATVYTRNNPNCKLYNDEDLFEELTNTPYEQELVRFDQSLPLEKRNAVVFFGSSSIRFWSTLPQDFPEVSSGLINRGFGGSTLAQCWEQFKRVILPLEPRVLILYAGENDIAIGSSPSTVMTHFKQFISVARRFYPSLPIAFISMKPSPSRLSKLSEMNETNILIRNHIQNLANVNYIDIFNEMLTSDQQPRTELFGTDMLHMNAQGYAIWTRAVKDYLKKEGFISSACIHRYTSFIIAAVSLACHLLILDQVL